MATIPYVLVDAFTSEPFAGNPAAVCLLTDPLPRETLQAIASEFNLSETAFVRASMMDLSCDGLHRETKSRSVGMRRSPPPTHYNEHLGQRFRTTGFRR